MVSIREPGNRAVPVGTGSRTEHGPVTRQSLGVAFAVPSLLSIPLLVRGGLAPFVVTAGVALLLGAPAALATWRTPEGSPGDVGPAGRAARASLAELSGLLLVSTALASLAASGSTGLVLAVIAWPAGALVARWPRWVAIPATLAMIGLGAAVVAGVAASPPWTLLEPHWDTWRSWLGPAATAGVLLGGAGTGHWTVGPRRPPGDRHTPWAVVGFGLLVAPALAVELGSRFEATLGAPGTSLVALGLTALGLLSTTATTSLRSDLRLAVRTAAGVATTLILAGPAAGIRPWIGSVVVPALAAVLLGAVAARAEGPDRGFAGVAAVVLAVGAAAAWPGMPEHTADAVWIGLVGVAGFWFVATRTLIARRTT